MTNRTLNQIDREVGDRDVSITFLVQQDEISLHTNLPDTDQLSIPVSARVHTQWLIGRSHRCAIVLRDSTISHQHAVLGYDVHDGFYIMDVSSRNGTFLNQSRLTPLQHYILKDRDRLTLTRQTIQIHILYNDSEAV